MNLKDKNRINQYGLIRKVILDIDGPFTTKEVFDRCLDIYPDFDARKVVTNFIYHTRLKHGKDAIKVIKKYSPTRHQQIYELSKDLIKSFKKDSNDV